MGKGRAKSRRKERETRGVRTWCWGMAKGGGGSTPEQFSPAAEGKKKKIKVLFISLPTLSMDSGENN